MKLAIQLFAIAQVLKFTAKRHAAFRERIKQKNMVAQLKLQDDSVGRYIEFRDGKIYSRSGLHNKPDVVVFFKTEMVATKFLSPKQDYLFNIDAMKNFKMGMTGEEELTSWLMETISMAQTVGWVHGEDIGNGVRRFTNNSNGGPLHVYVKDGKIVRVTPIEFKPEDSPGWTIAARGRTFTPPHQSSAAPYGLCSKSMVYSKDRLLYPMKRVDWDPNGERNAHNRGISGYQRITWDEAFDLVGGEFKRVKRDFGPGAIALSHGSHHTFGNIGYYLSALYRFFNLVGFTKVHHNPDSWEGWYWGAAHHWGHSMRLGIGEVFGQVEDALKECEMMVFWSSDPETTNGVYGAFEGTIRRLWAKELGIKFVHIDPHYNHTAALLGGKWIAPRPGTDPALAQAICHVWISEGLYDKKFVETRTTGFDEWAEYIMGRKDGVPKTPEWAAAETGVPARDIVALAREWGRKKTYLGAGGAGNGVGGACRTATGAQWARMMVILMAMQGIGRPGVNFGNMQIGTPIDFSFWFPGYAEGGISGDLMNTALRAQHLPAHPPHPDHEHQQADDSPFAAARGDPGRQGARLPHRSARGSRPVSALRLSRAWPFAGSDPLQVRRGLAGNDDQRESLGPNVPLGKTADGDQPVDLDGGRDQVCRRHPAGLHELREGRHRRVGRDRRLWPPVLLAAQPSGHGAPAQMHRTAGGIEVRLPDFPRPWPNVWGCRRHFRRG